MNNEWLIVIYRDKDKICYHVHMDKSYVYTIAGSLMRILDNVQGNELFGVGIFQDDPKVIKAIKDNLHGFDEREFTNTEIMVLLNIAKINAECGMSMLSEGGLEALL